MKKVLIILSFSYVLILCVFMLLHRSWFSPDQFFLFALLPSAFIGRFRVFIFDWLPFILSFLGYEFLRSVVPFINKNVHIFGMIKLDKFIFGYLPSTKFQSLFYNPQSLHWYDYLSATLYISHFVVPMAVGYLFWLKDRKLFKEFSAAFLALSYLGLITFVLFPAMPPWMASNFGYIPQIKQILGEIMSHFTFTNVSFPTVYAFVGSDPVAAIPSLHAAFPLLITLFMIKKFRKIGLIFILYVLGVWFAVIYLGEHYFTDILVGAVYALIIFSVLENRNYLLSKLRWIYFKYLSKKEIDLDIAREKN